MPQPFRPDTLETIRLGLGTSLGVVQTHTTTSTGDTTSVISTSLRGGSNAHRGKWVRIVSGAATVAPEGEVQQVTAFDGTSDMTTDAFTATIASGVDFELWDHNYSPADIDRLINRAINMAYRKSAVDQIVDVGGSRKISRYDQPANMLGVSSIEYRASVTGQNISTEGSAFDKTVDSDITASSDTKDLRWGSASSKFVVADAAAVNDTASDDVENTPLDLSGLTHLELWTKDEIPGTPAAADWTILLKAATVTKETLAIPVLTDQTWQYHQIALAEPQDDTAIDEVVLQMTTDVGLSTVWLNYVWATRADSATYEFIHPSWWNIRNNQIVFTKEARDLVGNRMIRIHGVQAPRALSADTDVTQVDPDFIIDMAMALADRQASRVTGDRVDTPAQLAQQERQLAEVKLARLGGLIRHIRWFD